MNSSAISFVEMRESLIVKRSKIIAEEVMNILGVNVVPFGLVSKFLNAVTSFYIKL